MSIFCQYFLRKSGAKMSEWYVLGRVPVRVATIVLMREMLSNPPLPATEQTPRKRPFGCLIFVLVLILLALLPVAWRKLVQLSYARHIHTVESAPSEQVAIVYGAAVYANGRLSTVLRDRMDTAIALYEAGKVDTLLVSGANNSAQRNEPEAMRLYALSRGVAPQAILVDSGGLRTYDTCYRARHEFGVVSAVLVTQEFHLPRALFTCRQLGITAVGVTADLRPYRGARWYALRETAATLVALWDVTRMQPAQILGNPVSHQ